MPRFLTLGLILLLLSSCVVPTPLPQPAATAAPTNTLPPVATAPPTATATAAPTPNPPPTVEPAPTPAAVAGSEYRNDDAGLVWQPPAEGWIFQAPPSQASDPTAPEPLALLVATGESGGGSASLHAFELTGLARRTFKDMLRTDPETAVRFMLIDVDLGRLRQAETVEVAGRPAVAATITAEDGSTTFLWILNGDDDILYLVARGFEEQAEAAVALQRLQLGAQTPAVAAPPSPDALTERLIAQVEELRGLSLQQEVPFELLDRADLGAKFDEMADEEDDPGEVAQYGEMLKLLELIPEDSQLAAMMDELHESQVSGFYDDESDTFYLVQDEEEEAFGVEDQITFVHEFAHALQDQYFDLSTFSDAEALGFNEDERGAVQALVEGEATLVMLLWMLENLELADIAELASGADEVNTDVLDEMPPYLVQGTLFPYEAGYVFAQSIFLQDGWEGINGAWEALPASTEQILHPERYPSDVPTEVSLPADLAAALGDGWTEQLRDVWGEIDLLLWLDEAGQRVARQGADGWDGSQYAFLADGDGRRLFVIEVAWDSAAEAAQGRESIAAVLAARGYQAGEGSRLASDERYAYATDNGDRVYVAIADDADALEAALVALGWGE